MNKLFLAVAIGATIASTQAGAQRPIGGMQQDMTRQQSQQMADTMFQQLDANHDGVVTRAEADQAATRFAAARGGDSNGGHGGGRIQRMIDRAFGNAQSLTLAQFEASAVARFDSQDLNHDGIVSAAERQQSRAERQGRQ
jgi:hypothetical protein